MRSLRVGVAASVIALAIVLVAVYNPAQPTAAVTPSFDGPSDVDTRFTTWVQEFKADEASTLSVRRGATLAAERAISMRQLIRHDPEAAIRKAIKPHVRNGLPGEVSAHVETWVSGKASIDVLCPFFEHAEDLSGEDRDKMGNDANYHHVVTFEDGREYKAFTFGRRSGRPERNHVSVYGVVIEDQMALHPSPLRLVDDEEAAALSDLADTDSERVLNHDMVCPHTGLKASPDAVAEVNGKFVFFHDKAAAVEYGEHLEEREDNHHLSTRAFNHMTRVPLKMLVMIVRFSDEADYPTTEDSYSEVLATTEGFWDINSNGQSTVESYTYVLVPLSGSRADYSTSGGSSVCPITSKNSNLDNDALSYALAEVGQSEDYYERYLIVFSKFDECPWAGLGSIANTGTWINGRYEPVAHWHVTAHELGHNYGLKHADLWAGGGASPISGGGAVAYGDDFDIMGAVHIDHDQRFSFHANVEKKNILEWVPDSDVTEASVSGRYRVYAHDFKSATGTRAVKIFKSGDTWYWIEYRVTIDYGPARAFFLNGASIRWGYAVGGFGSETDLLDMTPGYVSDESYDDKINNSPLQLGTTFADGSMHITPVLTGGVDRPYLEVVVNFVSSNPNPPVITETYSSCDAPEVGEAVLLTVSVSDTDNDELAFFWDFGDGSLSTVNNINVMHSWSSTGSKTVTVTVSDMKGRTAQGTTTVDVKGVGSSECPPCANNCFDRGSCAGGVCDCSPGYTGADCGTELFVDSLRFNFGPLAGGDIVTVTGGGFSSGSSLQCLFTDVALTTATFISDTEVQCPSPPHTVNESVVVEVTPNSGGDFSGSGILFTYGGGSCPANCSGHGECDLGPGRCYCEPGWANLDCAEAISVTGLTPPSGPLSGGSTVVLSTNFSASLATAPACRFGSLPPVEGSYAAGALSCVAPTFGATRAVVVEASPNGVDYTDDGFTFSYLQMVTLVGGKAEVGNLGAGERTFFKYSCPQAGLPLTVTLTGGGTMYAAVDEIPDETSPTSSSSELSFTSAVGTYNFVVVSPTAVTFTITATLTGDVTLVTDGDAVQTFNSASGSGYSYFTIRHVENGMGLVATAVATDGVTTAPVVVLGRQGTSPTLETNDGAGTYVSLQACDRRGDYVVGVQGTGVFEVRAFTVAPPSLTALSAEMRAGQIGGLTRGTDYVSLQWPFATDASSYDFDLRYDIYIRDANPEEPFDTPCDVISVGTLSVENVEYSSFSFPEQRIEGLVASTNYDVSIVVTNSYGVSNTYEQILQRTKPPAIPTSLIAGVFAGCIVIALTAGVVVFVVKIRGTRPKRRKHHRKRKKKKSTTGSNPRRGPRAGGPRATGVRQGRGGNSVASAGAGTGSGAAAGAGTAAVAGAGPRGAGPRAGGRRAATAGTAGAGTPRGSARTSARAGTAGAGAGAAKAAQAGGTKNATGSGASAGKPKIVGIALSDFHAQYDNELPFKKGDTITLLKDLQNGWLRGELNGRVGLIPADYVKKVKAKTAS